MACIAQRYPAVKLLLEHKVNPSATNRDPWTPLHEAVHYNRTDLLELLLAYQPNLEIHNADIRYTLLCKAVADKKVGCVKLLADAKANIRACNRDGWTALDEGTFHGNFDITQYLLKAGADPNGRRDNKKGPERERG